MKYKKCKKCNNDMFVDSWEGWRWHCIFCDTFGRKATDKEIADQRSLEYAISKQIEASKKEQS